MSSLDASKLLEAGGLLNYKQSYCIEMLTQGYVHSFVDFFRLTHERDSDKPAPAVKLEEGEQQPKRKDFDDETLRQLKDNLILAEASAREGTHFRVRLGCLC